MIPRCHIAIPRESDRAKGDEFGKVQAMSLGEAPKHGVAARSGLHALDKVRVPVVSISLELSRPALQCGDGFARGLPHVLVSGLLE